MIIDLSALFYIIIGALTLVFTLAVYTGLEKGIKLLGKAIRPDGQGIP